jgi:hypothetical protein
MRLLSIITFLFAFSAKSIHLISTTKKPVILLDVDGVINILGSGKIWRDMQTKKVASDGEIIDVCYSPSMIDSINKWHARADIKWLTNWDEEAKLSLSPALGLYQFKMARTNDHHETKIETANRIAQEVGDKTLMIWIDSEIETLCDTPEMKKMYTRPNTLLISPDWGLSPEEVNLVDECVNGLETWKERVIREFGDEIHFVDSKT